MSKIIVIENEENVRANLIELLVAEGYQTIEAKNGEEAYRLILKEVPDLIICDILMPELDGYGLLARCSQEPLTAMIPFIFLTALNERDDLRKGMELGADDFITKPYTRNEILRAIEARIDKRSKAEKFSQEKFLELENKLEWAIPFELLEPINTLLHHSDSLINQDNRLSASDFPKIGAEIRNTLSRLVDLIQDFVLYSELGNFLLDEEKLKVMRNSRVHQVDQLITEITNSKLVLEGRVKDIGFYLDQGDIGIDETYLQKILEIVLDNILSRTGTRKEIEIRGISNMKKHRYLLCIYDQGRIMKEDQVRLINSSNHPAGLTRLDYKQDKPDIRMLVLKRILDIFDGAINVSTANQGKTQFQIDLPMPG